jgi:hypothetical protein
MESFKGTGKLQRSFKGTHHCIANSINQATKPIISPNTLCGGKKRGG